MTVGCTSFDAGAGKVVILDRSGGRECLQDWKANQMELLTDEEYKRYEAEAGEELRLET